MPVLALRPILAQANTEVMLALEGGGASPDRAGLPDRPIALDGATFRWAAEAMLGAPHRALPLATLVRECGREKADAMLRLGLLGVHSLGGGDERTNGTLAQAFRESGDGAVVTMSTAAHYHCLKQLEAAGMLKPRAAV